MPARFGETINALDGGIRKIDADEAIRNIESWEEHIREIDVTGAKTLQADLAALKRTLLRQPIDGAAVSRVVAKLAGQTLRMAGRAEGKRAAQIEALGRALERAI